MQWLIVRTYSLMILFVVSISAYAIMLVVGPLKDIGKYPLSIQYFIYSPVFSLEALWLIQRETTINLIKASMKRVTNYSAKCN